MNALEQKLGIVGPERPLPRRAAGDYAAKALTQSSSDRVPTASAQAGREGSIARSHSDDIGPKVLSARDFLSNFTPVETIVDGLPIPRGGLTSITGPTGHGKTTISVALEIALVRGDQFAARAVTKGNVLVLAGENPDDWAMHLSATLQESGLTQEDLVDDRGRDSLLVVPRVFGLAGGVAAIRAMLDEVGGSLVAVIVDTSAAFYEGDDENCNTTMRTHAARLRDLCRLPGNPAVIVLCHPTKGATRENLLPRGGGAFLAEVDANLTTWKDEDGVITLSHAGKIRGAHFDPLRFVLQPVQLRGVLDSRGNPISSVVAKHLPEERAEQLVTTALAEENRVLLAMLQLPDASVAELARQAGFVSNANAPQKSTVLRLLKKLEAQKLVAQDRKATWQLALAGRKVARELQ